MYSRQGLRLTLATVITMLAVLVVGAFAGDYYVDKNVSGGTGSGNSWANAKTTIAAGIGLCSGSSADTVHVAQGTYVEAATLQLKDWVTLLGGYQTGGGTRDPDTYVTTIDGNNAHRVMTLDDDDHVMIDGFTITKGRQNDAGGIYCQDSSPVVINDCKVVANLASNGNGGGIYIKGCSPTITGCVITLNDADDGSGDGRGGGIYCYGASPTIRECTVSENWAEEYGGGIYCTNSSSPSIEDCTIEDNTVQDQHGGGFYLTGGSATILGCSIGKNASTKGDGGGIYCTGSSKPTVDSCTIKENSAGAGDGGGICLSGCAKTTTITNCYISVNTAGYHGPGIYAYDSDGLVVSLCEIFENETYNGNGGGIYLHSCCNTEPNICDCCIYSNYVENGSEGYGGGIYCAKCGTSSNRVSLRNILLYDNTAKDGCGGGFYNWDSYCNVFNCLIVKNTATGSTSDGYGGGVYCTDGSGSELILTNCTFNLNESRAHGSGKTGGAVYVQQDTTITLLNCILWGNVDYNGSADEIGLGGSGTHTGRCKVSYSDVGQSGGFTDDGHNINGDPKFCYRGGNTNFDGYFLNQVHTPCDDVANGDGDDASRYGTGSPNSNTEYSTDPNGATDNDTVDMGYHYRFHHCTYIELDSFEARAERDSVILRWETAAEIDNAGFVVFRANARTEDYEMISDLIAAQGSPTGGASYAFTDGEVEPGVVYNYWLVDIDTTGKWTAHGPVSARVPLHLDVADELRNVNYQPLVAK